MLTMWWYYYLYHYCYGLFAIIMASRDHSKLDNPSSEMLILNYKLKNYDNGFPYSWILNLWWESFAQAVWRGVPTKLNTCPHSREIREYFYKDVCQATKNALKDGKHKLRVQLLLSSHFARTTWSSSWSSTCWFVYEIFDKVDGS